MKRRPICSESARRKRLDVSKKEQWRVVQRKLKMVDVAQRLSDLSSPPGNRLEVLKGKERGRHSIRVNDQYRVTSRWGEIMPTKSAAKTITRDPEWVGPAVHPGEMLREEFLVPLGLTQVAAARQLAISVNRLNELVLGRRGVTADTALRLARRFKTTPHSGCICRPIGICAKR
jgi:addiction module HigA family antidote